MKSPYSVKWWAEFSLKVGLKRSISPGKEQGLRLAKLRTQSTASPAAALAGKAAASSELIPLLFSVQPRVSQASMVKKVPQDRK